MDWLIVDVDVLLCLIIFVIAFTATGIYAFLYFVNIDRVLLFTSCY